MNCLSNEQLVQYVEGFLNNQARDSIKRHIETCTNCRVELEIFSKLRRRLVEYGEFFGRKAFVKKEVMNCIERIDHDPSVSDVYKPTSAMRIGNRAVQTSNLSTSKSEKHHYSVEVKTMSEIAKPVSKKKIVPLEYARRQESVESEEKIHLARFAIQICDLKDGEGLVVDAGSSSLAFFKECGAMIEKTHTYILFYTNSYQILEYWEASRDPGIRDIELSILGSKLDRRHLAFHGDIASVMLKPNIFRPAVVVIGTSGIIFDPQDGILLSYHAEGPEEKFKQLLFQCFAGKKRVILCTARKIGFVGAYAFDLLRTDIVDVETPICLITTGPKSGDEETAKRFYEMREIFYSEEMRKRIKVNSPGLSFEWIVLDPESGERIYDKFDKKKQAVNPQLVKVANNSSENLSPQESQ